MPVPPSHTRQRQQWRWVKTTTTTTLATKRIKISSSNHQNYIIMGSIIHLEDILLSKFFFSLLLERIKVTILCKLRNMYGIIKLFDGYSSYTITLQYLIIELSTLPALTLSPATLRDSGKVSLNLTHFCRITYIFYYPQQKPLVRMTRTRTILSSQCSCV